MSRVWMSRADQSHHELEVLLALTVPRNPITVVELGVLRGESMRTWQEAFPAWGCVGIDRNDDRTYVDGYDFIQGSTQESDIAQKALDALSGFPKVGLVRKPMTIDFLFMDADHSYEGFRREWDVWSPHVTPREGLAVVHDIHHPGKAAFWQELKYLHTTVEILGPYGFDARNYPTAMGTGVVFL